MLSSPVAPVQKCCMLNTMHVVGEWREAYDIEHNYRAMEAGQQMLTAAQVLSSHFYVLVLLQVGTCIGQPFLH